MVSNLLQMGWNPLSFLDSEHLFIHFRFQTEKIKSSPAFGKSLPFDSDMTNTDVRVIFVQLINGSCADTDNPSHINLY